MCPLRVRRLDSQLAGPPSWHRGSPLQAMTPGTYQLLALWDLHSAPVDVGEEGPCPVPHLPADFSGAVKSGCAPVWKTELSDQAVLAGYVLFSVSVALMGPHRGLVYVTGPRQGSSRWTPGQGTLRGWGWVRRACGSRTLDAGHGAARDRCCHPSHRLHGPRP